MDSIYVDKNNASNIWGRLLALFSLFSIPVTYVGLLYSKIRDNNLISERTRLWYPLLFTSGIALAIFFYGSANAMMGI
jgi:hypothetical protein